MEYGRLLVFIFTKKNWDSIFLDNTVIGSSNCAKNFEDGSCELYNAHEYFTSVERSKLRASEQILTKTIILISNIDVSKSWVRERLFTKWNFQRQINILVFAALV